MSGATAGGIGEAPPPPFASIVNLNVGVMGHVDSGKTSLVKALSTHLSTASIDKHPQSQERGITLDLVGVACALPLLFSSPDPWWMRGLPPLLRRRLSYVLPQS
jgi:hypothetical protein